MRLFKKKRKRNKALLRRPTSHIKWFTEGSSIHSYTIDRLINGGGGLLSGWPYISGIIYSLVNGGLISGRGA